MKAKIAPRLLVLAVIMAISLACSFGTGISHRVTETPPQDVPLKSATSTVWVTIIPSKTPANPPTQTQGPTLSANSKPLLNGLVLANAQETESFRSVNTPNFYTAAKEQYTNADLNKIGSDLPYTIQVNRADQALIWYHGWCSDSQATLQSVLDSLETTLSVNSQIVDLTTVLQQDYRSLAGKYCHGMWMAVHGWPAGQTVIQFKTVDEAGVRTQTFNITFGSQEVSATQSGQVSDMPTFASEKESQIEITSYQVTYLEDAADGFVPKNLNQVDQYFNISRNIKIYAPSKQKHLVWANGWCAADQTTLTQNLKKIRFEMSVNDQPVDLGQFYQADFPSASSKGYCRIYRMIVYNWPSGTTSLISKTILTGALNDGRKDYPAGDMSRLYIVRLLGQ